jgi:hypothetical protein
MIWGYLMGFGILRVNGQRRLKVDVVAPMEPELNLEEDRRTRETTRGILVAN